MRFNNMNDKMTNELISLCKIISSMYNLYKKLSRLEFEGEKNTSEYAKYLSILKDASQILDQKIERYFYNEQKLSRSIRKILLPDFFDLFMIRIMSHYDYDVMDVYDFYNMIPEKKVDLPSKNNNKMLKMYRTQMEVKTWFERAKTISFLIYLQQEIDCLKQTTEKKELLELKYNLVFSKKVLEEEMIHKYFNIPKIMPDFKTPPLVNEYNYSYYTNFKNSMGMQMCKYAIGILLEMGYCTNNEYEIDLFDVIFNKISLQVGLQMIDKPNLNYLYNETNKKIEALENAANLCDKNTSNNPNKKLVLQLFKQVKSH